MNQPRMPHMLKSGVQPRAMPMPQLQPKPRRATYRDVLDAPPHKVAEIINGKLHLMPRPAPPHVSSGASLHMIVGSAYQKGIGGPGGWRIMFEPELHFGEDVLVPDIAGWRRERLPELPGEAYFTLAPDWVCEVLSDSTRENDLGPKRAIYAREGVAYLWFVDPEPRTLDAFELRNGGWHQIAALSGEDPVSVPPFNAIRFPLDAIWPEGDAKSWAPVERR